MVRKLKDLLGKTVYKVRDEEFNHEFYTFIKPMSGEKLLGTTKITPSLLKKLELWGQDKFLLDEVNAGMRLPK